MKRILIVSLMVLCCSLFLFGCGPKPNDGVTDLTVEYIGQ